jgi:hypothetical protein
MKTLLLAASVAALLAVGPALAQDTTVTSGSNSGATSGSVSGAVTGPVTVGPIDGSSRSVSDSNSSSSANAATSSQSQATGGTATSGSTATTGASTASSVTGPSTSGAAQNQTADNAGNAQSITFNTTNPDSLKTVPQVYAPALSTTLTETCMGSTSGGVSVLGFGGTLGTTWNDNQCVRRLNAREMAQTFGDRDAARALLCQDPDVAEAYAAVGQSCFVAQPKVAVMSAPPGPPVSTPPPVIVPPVTMQPIPNPPPEHDGERGSAQ